MKNVKSSLANAKLNAIIDRVQAYGPYPTTKISEPAIRLLDKAAASLPHRPKNAYVPLLKLLECYLCITRQTLRCNANGALRIGSLYHEFTGALYSPKFWHATEINRYAMVRAWNRLVEAIDKDGLSHVRIYHLPSSKYVTDEIESLVQVFEARALDADEVFFWRSSQIYRRNGGARWLSLRPIALRYGRAFTEFIHAACRTYVYSNEGRLVEINIFLNFLAELPSEFHLKEFKGNKMEDIWARFKKHFVKLTLGPSIYRNVVVNWQHFIDFALTHLNRKGPFGSGEWNLTPLPNLRDGAPGPHIKEGPDGKLVAEKLLVDVPLEVTDNAALQIIFEELNDRTQKISAWAKKSTSGTWSRYLRRLEAASKGDSTRGGIYNAGHFTDAQFARIAAKFEKSGFKPTVFERSNLARPLGTTAFELGLPLTGTLLPHMTLLVIAHPELTPSFFDTCELYDKSGQINGFLPTALGTVFQGFKPRRGPNLAQQPVYLTPDTKELISQVITLTAPLRRFLKAQGDDNWRKLFLSCGAGFAYPKGIKATGLTADVHRVAELKSDFVKMGLVRESEVSLFVARFSLISLRASTAVVSYIQKPDVTALAKKLGHAKYTPKLLARYMPAPLLTFFQQRWVRLFQSAIIATAMGKSEYALQATGFQSMEQMHEFLKNHALKLKPRHADKEKYQANLNSKELMDEVVFSVSVENLTLLVSLVTAAKSATRKITAVARYWAVYGERLIEHIDNLDDNSADLQDMLVRARALASPDKAGDFIYA